MIRTLLRYLANNEKLVERLSDSYLMRRAAQMAVSVFYRAKSVAQEATEERIKDMSPQKFRSFIDKFQNNVKEELEKAKNEIDSKTKKH
ncbi:CLUMA_CG002229, isoform A [Clunio marinus]|uniref:CLUMA_CG002229, isoform A n=1 Tax=Clunio marinus TaxID=568069 RepID=A0A1J1HPS7_9DIPT|nr:CLUMA_CG002229, isoform A [Clunio marinus]